MKLITEIEAAIWAEFGSYKNVKNYIKKWYKHSDEQDISDWENFHIYENNAKIDLNETLHGVDSETILKIAVDLGLETPDIIASVPVIKNVLKNNYSTAATSFEKALKNVEENPSLAIGLANSTLESIIKHILENDDIKIENNKKNTLYDLTQNILKEFSLYPNTEMPAEIRDIGSGLLKVIQGVEKLRSEKTEFHGKTKDDYVITDPLYAYFIINTVTTIGLFLISYYKSKYNKVREEEEQNDVNLDDIPF